MTTKNFYLGFFFAISSAVLFSAKAVVAKLLYLQGVDVFTVIALRMLFALPFFILLLCIPANNKVPLTPTNIFLFMLLGFIGYYLSTMLDLFGLLFISVGLERLLLFLSPTFVLLLNARFFGEPITRLQCIAFIIAYSGIIFSFFGDLQVSGWFTLLGSILVLLSAGSYSVYLVVCQKTLTRVPPLQLVGWVMSFATLFSWIQFCIFGNFSDLFAPAKTYALAGTMGLLCTFFPVVGTTLALRLLGANLVALISMIGPVSVLALGYCVLSEPIGVVQIFGSVFVMFGIFLLRSKEKSAKTLSTT